MKIYISIICISILFISCNSNKIMTNYEKELINNGNLQTPMRVLLTTNLQDSLFLRKKSLDIPDVENIANNKDLQIFIERLKQTLVAESGVGIAAPQVGIGRNIFLFLRIDKENHPVQVAINPRIINHSTETICFERDGCLSVPELSGNTNRYEWVEVEYYDENGKNMHEKLSGTSRQSDFTGVIFQHEFDHLQGILFIDRLCE